MHYYIGVAAFVVKNQCKYALIFYYCLSIKYYYYELDI